MQNEDYLLIKTIHDDGQEYQTTEWDQINQDVDENYIGVSHALRQAEDILQKAKNQSKTRVSSVTSSYRPGNEFSPEYLSPNSPLKSLKNSRTLSMPRYSINSNESITNSEVIKMNKVKTPKKDFSQLEAIIEKDFEAIDEFKTKWTRYENLVQDSLNDRK